MNIWEKVEGRSNTWEDTFDFCGVSKGSSFSRSGPEACRQKCDQGIFLKNWGAGPTPGGNLSDFCRVLKKRPFYEAGPETCHKKCARDTFWKKWGAGQTPGGTYLIFVGPWKGGRFTM